MNVIPENLSVAMTDGDIVRERACALLRRRLSPEHGEGIHLDIGWVHHVSGAGRASAGCLRVSVRLCANLASIAEGQGSEMHDLSPDRREEMHRQIGDIVGRRKVVSIALLGTLEYAPDCEGLLNALADLVRRHGARLVISVANIACRAIGAKLALGAWNGAPGRRGDELSRFFDHRLLAAMLGRAGLRVIEKEDIADDPGGGAAPEDHPALAGSSLLNNLLFSVAAQANPCSAVRQFVWLCGPGDEAQDAGLYPPREEEPPFLSIVIRTQGKRLHTLVETLACLCGQTDIDFEALVMGHRMDEDATAGVMRVLEDMPDWLRRKIRFIPVSQGNRTRPLNVGFAMARGHYIAALDDDDIPMGNWVEVFHQLSREHPGQILRAACVRQDVVNVRTGDRDGLRSEGAPECLYPSTFDLFEHLSGNYTPFMSLAYPRGAFHDLGIRFDETLSTTEDWDFTLRVCALCGVASSPEITSIYRWWAKDESSRTVHPEDEWRRNRNAIFSKQGRTLFILPRGEIARMRKRRRSDERSLRNLSPDLKSVLRKTIGTQMLLARMKRMFLAFSKERKSRYTTRIRRYRDYLRKLEQPASDYPDD